MPELMAEVLSVLPGAVFHIHKHNRGGHIVIETNLRCRDDGSVEPLGETISYGEAEQALQAAREATDGALEQSGIFEAVNILISQRDNARNTADVLRRKLKGLGHGYA